MPILIHLIVLVSVCLFGYRSEDDFELLIVGIVGLMFAHIMASEGNLAAKIRITCSYVLRLIQAPTVEDEREIDKLAQAIKKDRTKPEDVITCLVYMAVSSVLICKSIIMTLLEMGN
jgi:hypothetical protein